MQLKLVVLKSCAYEKYRGSYSCNCMDHARLKPKRWQHYVVRQASMQTAVPPGMWVCIGSHTGLPPHKVLCTNYSVSFLSSAHIPLAGGPPAASSFVYHVWEPCVHVDYRTTACNLVLLVMLIANLTAVFCGQLLNSWAFKKKKNELFIITPACGFCQVGEKQMCWILVLAHEKDSFTEHSNSPSQSHFYTKPKSQVSLTRQMYRLTVK